MGKFDKQTYDIVKRLQNARLSLLVKQPFYALLLLHMKFALDITCETAYTDGTRIAFNSDFINSLSDSELEFVLMHEVMHAALGHPFRHQADYDLECYDKACDIVVNSNILYSFDMDIARITLKNYGEAMHLTPSGKEGYLFTVEEVYRELLKVSPKQSKSAQNGVGGGLGTDGSSDDSHDNTDHDNTDSGDDDPTKTNAQTASSKNKSGNSKGGKGNSQQGSGKGNGQQGGGTKGRCKGRGTSGGKDEDTAAAGGGGGDSEITDGDLNELIASLLKGRNADEEEAELEEDTTDDGKQGEVDDHSFWNGDDDGNLMRDTWLNRMIEATDLIEMTDKIASSQGGKGRGITPLAAMRVVSELKKPKLDWKTILNQFVQEEICDYSFSPPDKRMEECPFFLPDFNEKDERVKDILFMIDTSGSMGDDQINECYSEIYGAIQQFGGKLQGKLGFFDAAVVEPIPFEDEDEFKIIRPYGGGGTSFEIIFDYIQKHMQDEPPVSIVILTDGYAPFPDEERACGIPVLWIINNNDVDPPWGKIARILKNVP